MVRMSSFASPHRAQEAALSIVSSSPIRAARATAGSSRSSASTLPGQGETALEPEDRPREPLARQRRPADATPCGRCCARPACSRRATRRGWPRSSGGRPCRCRSAQRGRERPGLRAGAHGRRPTLHSIVGRVRKAHGIRGELVVEPITDGPDAIFAPGRRVFVGTAAGDARPRPPRTARDATRPFNEGLLVHVRRDRRTAPRPRPGAAATSWCPRRSSPPPDDDEVYVHDLSGMRVVLADGAPVGHGAERVRAAAGAAPSTSTRDRDRARCWCRSTTRGRRGGAWTARRVVIDPPDRPARVTGPWTDAAHQRRHDLPRVLRAARSGSASRRARRPPGASTTAWSICATSRTTGIARWTTIRTAAARGW